MPDHFSYLFDEPSSVYLQKVAVVKANVPTSPAAPPMAKTASEMSPFAKLASQLDRNIEIIRSCGKSGSNAGMQKRAGAYVDLLFNSGTDLSPDEFGEIFDKVSAAAIQGDLEAIFTEICSEAEAADYPIIEAELAKIGRDLTSMALMEKEALLAALRGGLGAAKGVARYLGRGAAKPFVAAGQAAGQGVARAGKSVAKSAPFVGTKAREARHLKTINAPDKARAALSRVQQATGAGGLRGAAAQGAMPAAQKNVEIASAKARKAIEKKDTKMRAIDKGWDDAPSPRSVSASPAAAPPNTTAPRGAAAPSAAAAGQAKTIKAEGERSKAVGDAAEAAKPKARPELGVIQGGKGTGTDGPAPKPKPDESPALKTKESGGGSATPAPPASVDTKAPGVMDAWKKATNSGWGTLSPQEKGALIRAGVTAALVTRAVTGKGAVTGGEGLV